MIYERTEIGQVDDINIFTASIIHDKSLGAKYDVRTMTPHTVTSCKENGRILKNIINLKADLPNIISYH